MVAVCYESTQEGNFLSDLFASSRPYSEETAQLIDSEIRSTVKDQLQRARSVLQQHRDKLERVAGALLEREAMTRREFETVVGPRAVEPGAVESPGACDYQPTVVPGGNGAAHGGRNGVGEH